MSIQLLLSVIVASATVSTAVATGVTLWLRFRERPEPDWVVTASAYRQDASRYNDEPATLDVWGSVANVGDGQAFRVTLTPMGAEGHFFKPTSSSHLPRESLTHVALMGPGDQASFNVWAGPDDFDKVSMVVEWTISPTRKGKRRKQTFRLADLAERPAAEVEAPEEPAGG